jgi:hypothetical protein
VITGNPHPMDSSMGSQKLSNICMDFLRAVLKHFRLETKKQKERK